MFKVEKDMYLIVWLQYSIFGCKVCHLALLAMSIFISEIFGHLEAIFSFWSNILLIFVENSTIEKYSTIQNYYLFKFSNSEIWDVRVLLCDEWQIESLVRCSVSIIRMLFLVSYILKGLGFGTADWVNDWCSYSLDPDGDPLCMLLTMDFYALRASEYAFLVRMYSEWEDHRNLSQLPNFAFSVPLAMYHQAVDNVKALKEADEMVRLFLTGALHSNFRNLITSTNLDWIKLIWCLSSASCCFVSNAAYFVSCFYLFKSCNRI